MQPQSHTLAAMKTMIIKLALLAFAALPTVGAKYPYEWDPCDPPDFTLSMLYQAEFLALGAIDSGVDGMLNVVGFDPATYRGTPG